MTKTSRELSSFSRPELIKVIAAGLAFSEFEKLQAKVSLPVERLGGILGIARATLQRRKAAGSFNSGESEKIVRYVSLWQRAVETLGGMDEARAWLSTPQVGLGGALPLEYARTEIGAREVEDLLGRMEYGVYA